jgi:predicted PurR-regulated permease PerM
MPTMFNNHLRQVLLLGLVILLGSMLVAELYVFLPGFLGGVTLYILLRKWYQKLTIQKGWPKGLTAFLFIIASIVFITIPIYFSVLLISPKIYALINNQHAVVLGLETFSKKLEVLTGQQFFTITGAESIAKKIASYIPTLLNSTANVLTNLIMLFFLLYYLLYSGNAVEKYLDHIIPLKAENVEKLAHETDLMIRANAIGIPTICLVQGIFSAIGYLIFGVKDWGMWGFVTGVFAFFPLIGTMIVWVPLVIYLYSINQNVTATGLTIYSFVVTGNVDYITRLVLLKKIGNVHPMITILGVIVGLQLFGFMGLIFGPLLISYFIILIKIYVNEFTIKPDAKVT